MGLKTKVGRERMQDFADFIGAKESRLAKLQDSALVYVATLTGEDLPTYVLAHGEHADAAASIRGKYPINKVLWKGTGAEFLKLLPRAAKVVKKSAKPAPKKAAPKKVVKLKHARPVVKAAAVKRHKGPKLAR